MHHTSTSVLQHTIEMAILCIAGFGFTSYQLLSSFFTLLLFFLLLLDEDNNSEADNSDAKKAEQKYNYPQPEPK